MTHTKGPWQFLGHNHLDGTQEVGTLPDCVRLPDLIASVVAPEGKEAAKANALLIAAAPELLEALVAIDGLCWPQDNNGRTEAQWIDCQSKVRAAIAKATGAA